MPTIPFPDVPDYPGVPQIPRQITGSPIVSLGIGPILSVLANALQYPSPWGIYDSSGNPLGVDSSSPSFVGALEQQITGNGNAIQSTLSFDFLKETRISDFPVERGSFANYNKVEMPANPVVSLALSGSESDRADFLNAIDAACKSTELYTVITPEVTYYNYSLERYTYTRKSSKGMTLLVVEISLKEIRQVSASYSQTGPIVSPQSPSAAAQVDNGITQSTTPDSSVLNQIMTTLPQLIGAN